MSEEQWAELKRRLWQLLNAVELTKEQAFEVVSLAVVRARQEKADEAAHRP